MDYLLRLRVAHHRWDPTAYFCSFKLQHRGLVLLLVLCHVSNKHFKPGVNLDRYTQFKWFNNGKHKECAQILHHISVPPKTISYISAIITNYQGYRCCDRNSMGKSYLQVDVLHVSKPCK